jgi:hypothetical protein
VQRFGWLVDHVKADIATAYCRWPREAARPRSPPRAREVEGAIGYDETWRLFVNVARQELHGSAGLGRRKTIRKDS